MLSAQLSAQSRRTIGIKVVLFCGRGATSVTVRLLQLSCNDHVVEAFNSRTECSCLTIYGLNSSAARHESSQ